MHSSIMTGPRGILQASGFIDVDSLGARAYVVGELPLSQRKTTPDLQIGFQFKTQTINITPYINMPQCYPTTRPLVGLLGRGRIGAWQILVRTEVDTSRDLKSKDVCKKVDLRNHVYILIVVAG